MEDRKKKTLAGKTKRIMEQIKKGSTSRTKSTALEEMPPQKPPKHRRGKSEWASGQLPSYGRDDAGGRVNQITLFERGQVDIEADLKGLSEKGIDNLRADLAKTDAECEEEIRKAVYDHYQHFIGVTQGIMQLGGELQQLHNLLNNNSAMVAALKSVATPANTTSRLLPLSQLRDEESAAEAAWMAGPEGTKWTETVEEMDVAIAERRPSEALHLLRRADRTLAKLQGLDALSSRTMGQKAALDRRRTQLIAMLEAQMEEPGAGVAEVRAAAQLLSHAAGKARALRAMLDAHTARLSHAQQQLLKPQNSGGGAAEGLDYAGALAQQAFATIAAAAEDVAAVFQKDAPELGAVLLVWSLHEAERFCTLIKRNALSPFAAPAGLAPTVGCCQLAMTQCVALEQSHGLMLAPRLVRDLWPACEQVLQRRVRKTCEAGAASAAADLDAAAARAPGAMGSAPSDWSGLTRLLPSADFILDELQDIVTLMRPMPGPRLGFILKRALSEIFAAYTLGLSAAFARHKRSDGRFPPGLDEMLEGIMEAVTLLAEKFMPQLAASLQGRCESICDGPHLDSCITSLAESLGMTSAG
ncbi:hypothetical protein WJX84_010079 [Apatococcus fuscideae]|uniref:Exocyst component Exo84 C-terminal domain-containing protein n=1 Tax=Apatococcus fuscideae TaxID=2026836 RepID=A0AAW1RNX2_9CHLO